MNPPNIFDEVVLDEANGFAFGASDFGANGLSVDDEDDFPKENPESDDPNNPGLGFVDSVAVSIGFGFAVTFDFSASLSTTFVSFAGASVLGANPPKLNPLGFSFSDPNFDSVLDTFVSVFLAPKLNPVDTTGDCFAEDVPNRFVFNDSGGGVLNPETSTDFLVPKENGTGGLDGLAVSDDK